MTISYYESGERKTGIDTIKALAKVLGVKVTNFLSDCNENLVFVHGGIRISGKFD